MSTREASSHKSSMLPTCVTFASIYQLELHSEPTVFENYVHDLYVDEQLVELSLWDTAGTPVTLQLSMPCAVTSNRSLLT